MAKKKWYVVTVGKEIGVFTTWLAVAPLVLNVPGAQHQSFSDEAEARNIYNQLVRKGQTRVIVSGASEGGSSFSRAPSAAGTHRSSLPTPHPSPEIPPSDHFNDEEAGSRHNSDEGGANFNSGSSRNPDATTSGGSGNDTGGGQSQQRATGPVIVTKSYSVPPSTPAASRPHGAAKDLGARRPREQDPHGTASESRQRSATRIAKSVSLYSASSLSSPVTGVTYRADERGHFPSSPSSDRTSNKSTPSSGRRVVPTLEKEAPDEFLSPLLSPELSLPNLPSTEEYGSKSPAPGNTAVDILVRSPSSKAHSSRTANQSSDSPHQHKGLSTSVQNSSAASERTVPLHSSLGHTPPSGSDRNDRKNYRYSGPDYSDTATESDDDPVICVSPIIDTSTLYSSCSRHAAGYKFITQQSQITTHGNVREIVTVIHTQPTCHHEVCRSCRHSQHSRSLSGGRISVRTQSAGLERKRVTKRPTSRYETGLGSPMSSSIHVSPRRGVSGGVGEIDPRSPFSSKSMAIGGVFGTQFESIGRPSPLDSGMNSLCIQ